MASDEPETLGFIKYSGDGVADGLIDAGGAGSALLGLDQALRYFNSRQSPELAALEYDIPVQTRPGSWIVVVLGLLGAGAGTFALSYLKKAGEKMAENDVGKVGLKDVFRRSMEAIKSLAQLTKHTGHSRDWPQPRILLNEAEPHVVFVNDRAEELRIPLEFFRWYQSVPPRLLTRMTSVVRADRILTIGVALNGAFQEVEVSEADKALFDESTETLEEEALFPEFTNGLRVKLEGRLTRGNESTNSMGLEYQGHVLNCIPEEGSVRRFKPALFLRCIVEGHVQRHTRHRDDIDKKPTIIVHNVTSIETESQRDLFGD